MGRVLSTLAQGRKAPMPVRRRGFAAARFRQTRKGSAGPGRAKNRGHPDGGRGETRADSDTAPEKGAHDRYEVLAIKTEEVPVPGAINLVVLGLAPSEHVGEPLDQPRLCVQDRFDRGLRDLERG